MTQRSAPSTQHPLDRRTATYDQIRADFWPLLEKYRDVEGALLPILHEAQARYGWVSDPTVRLIAEFLHTTPPSVYAVLTYYHELSTTPPSDVQVVVCAGPACRVGGGPALQDALEEATGITIGDTRRDFRYSMTTSACLGVCFHAPAASFNQRVVGRIQPERVAHLLAEAEAAGPGGPQRGGA